MHPPGWMAVSDEIGSSRCYRRVADVEFPSHFHGYSLNAVDAKGRVSLPATFRAVIEKRVHPELAASEFPAAERTVFIGPHEELDCLVGYDSTYSRHLDAALEKRMAALGEEDELRGWDRVAGNTYGYTAPANYDDVGRMVLTSLNRGMAGITNMAYFFGTGRNFQIWSPESYRGFVADQPRVLRMFDMMLADKGIKL